MRRGRRSCRCRGCRAYAAAGIPINYISVQNEPLYVPTDYPGMSMDAATQQAILRDYVLPAFATNNISAKVLVYDHNWDTPDYPNTVLSDPTLAASNEVAGIAWHGYGGTPGAMTHERVRVLVLTQLRAPLRHQRADHDFARITHGPPPRRAPAPRPR